MMGAGHALSGAVVWLAGAPSAAASLGMGLTGSQLAVGTLTTAGAALACDIDHKDASIGRKFGPAGQVVAGTVQATVGHRTLTHSLFAIVLAGAGAAAAAWAATPVASAILVGALVYLGALLVGPSLRCEVSPLAGIAAGVAAGALVYSASVEPGGWLVLAVVMGVAAHIAGDAITPQGVPLFAPFSKRRFSLPLLTTGGVVEGALTACLAAALLWLSWDATVAYGAFSGMPMPWG